VSAPEKLMEAEDLVALTGMGIEWIWAETRAGRIPHVKLGRYDRYRPSSIQQWLADIETWAGVDRGGAAPTAPRMAQKE
jgi:predicted DNA-binding transcriptional regulator AlpA